MEIGVASVANMKSIRPGKVTGDPTVYDLRALQYKPNGMVNFKLTFTEGSSWVILLQRIHIPKIALKWLH